MIILVKSNSFFEAINEASIEQKDRLIAESESYREARLAEAKATADKKYYSMLSAAKTRLENEDGIRAMQRTYELKKEVADIRHAIENNVFAQVEAQLHDFTKSPFYRQFLINSATEMLKKCNGEEVTIFLKSNDIIHTEALMLLSDTISTDTDDNIKIGGIYGICNAKNIRLDDLLETRLALQKDWFYQNSGLG